MKLPCLLIFFISIFFAVVGSSEFLRELRYEIQKEIREEIAKQFYQEKDLIEFSHLQTVDFHWHSVSEFEFNGDFYDVVKIKDKNFLCIKDRRETQVRHLESRAKPLFASKNLRYSQLHPLSKAIKLNSQKKIYFYQYCVSSNISLLKNFKWERKKINFQNSTQKGFLQQNFSPPENTFLS